MRTRNRRHRKGASPTLGQSYIPQSPQYPLDWRGLLVNRFFWGLFLHPRRENWLLVGVLIGSIATFVALALAVGVIQANGLLDAWSLAALAVVAGLLALEYWLFRLRGKAERHR